MENREDRRKENQELDKFKAINCRRITNVRNRSDGRYQDPPRRERIE